MSPPLFLTRSHHPHPHPHPLQEHPPTPTTSLSRASTSTTMTSTTYHTPKTHHSRTPNPTPSPVLNPDFNFNFEDENESETQCDDVSLSSPREQKPKRPPRLKRLYVTFWIAEYALTTLSLPVAAISVILVISRGAPGLLRGAAGLSVFVSVTQIMRMFVVHFRPRALGDARLAAWKVWAVVLGCVAWCGAGGFMLAVLGIMEFDEYYRRRLMRRGLVMELGRRKPRWRGGGVSFDGMPVEVWWVGGGIAGLAFLISLWQYICVFRLCRNRKKYPLGEITEVDEEMVRVINNKWVGARGRWKAKSRLER